MRAKPPPHERLVDEQAVAGAVHVGEQAPEAVARLDVEHEAHLAAGDEARVLGRRPARVALHRRVGPDLLGRVDPDVAHPFDPAGERHPDRVAVRDAHDAPAQLARRRLAAAARRPHHHEGGEHDGDQGHGAGHAANVDDGAARPAAPSQISVRSRAALVANRAPRYATALACSS